MTTIQESLPRRNRARGTLRRWIVMLASRRLLVIVLVVASGFVATLTVGTSTVAGADSGVTPPTTSITATKVPPHLDGGTRDAAHRLSPGSSARLGSTVSASANPTTAGIGTVVTFSLTVEDTVFALAPLEVESFAAVLVSS